MRKVIEIEDPGVTSLACGRDLILLYVDGKIKVLRDGGKVLEFELPFNVWDGVALYYEKPYVLIYDGAYKLIEINVEDKELRVVQELKLNYGTVKVRDRYVLVNDVLMRIDDGRLKTVLRNVEAMDGRVAMININERRELVRLDDLYRRRVPINERVYCISRDMIIFGNTELYVGDIYGNKYYPIDFPSCMVEDVVYSRDKIFMIWTPTNFEKVDHVIQMTKCGKIIYVVTSRGLVAFEKEYSIEDVMISKLPLKVSFPRGSYFLRTNAEIKRIGESGERVGVSDECIAVYKDGKVLVRCNSKERVYHVRNVTWMEGSSDKIAVASSEGVYVIDSEGYLEGCHVSAIKAKIVNNKVFFFSPVDGTIGTCEKSWNGLVVTNLRRFQNIIDFDVGKREIYALFSTYESHGVHVEVYNFFLEHLESFTIPPSKAICVGKEFKTLGNSLYVRRGGRHDLVFRYEQCKGDTLSGPFLAVYDGRRVRETLIPASDSDEGRETVVTSPYGTYVITSLSRS